MNPIKAFIKWRVASANRRHLSQFTTHKLINTVLGYELEEKYEEAKVVKDYIIKYRPAEAHKLDSRYDILGI